MKRLIDLICLSHLRWDFVFQRPQHLMIRWARERRVFFFEEPVWHDGPAQLQVARRRGQGERGGEVEVIVAAPHLPRSAQGQEELVVRQQRALLDQLLRSHGVAEYLLWYYTPMALAFSGHLRPRAVVYDCMDELSAFAGAPPALRERETALLARADVVLTGGQSLYEAKRQQHRNIHPFPSSVDVSHFARARAAQPDPPDQGRIGGPRLGFFGVIDERMDLGLLSRVAAARPDWQLVMIGPVVKIDEASLPRGANIHYLGQRPYADLPAYLAGWDVALLPFARNEATRFISPTKTPEYLAAGKPVVSTSIRDVVEPYGRLGLVHIADTAPAFITAVEAALRQDRAAHQRAADLLLQRTSWDQTWARMRAVVEQALGGPAVGQAAGQTMGQAAGQAAEQALGGVPCSII
jgi:UDP-galactopyranose mutase